MSNFADQEFHKFLLEYGFVELSNENLDTNIYIKSVSIFNGKKPQYTEVNSELNFTMIIEAKKDQLGTIYELNASIDSGIFKAIPMFRKIGRDWKETIMCSQLLFNQISARMNFTSI